MEGSCTAINYTRRGGYRNFIYLSMNVRKYVLRGVIRGYLGMVSKGRLAIEGGFTLYLEF